MKYLLTDAANVQVLVVEPAASVRMMITDILRTSGYRNLHSVSSGKDALNLLEVEEIHWIIMPLMESESVNAMQILSLIVNEPSLSQTSSTLLIEPDTQDYCLPLAFELGLLSWAPRSNIKDVLNNSILDLVRLLATNKGNVILTASEYIRKFLNDKKMYSSRRDLEQTLLNTFPGSARQLLNLAEAEILSGNDAKAVGLLNQAEIIDESLAPAAKTLREKYLKNKNLPNPSVSENTLGIKTVVIVDPDTDVLFAAVDMFSQIGVDAVHTFEDGAKALEFLQASQEEPELLLMEWRLPGLNGPALIQRIRQHGFLQLPIIIASSLIKREEKPLLIEMGVDEILEKPFDRSTFFSVIVWAIQQNRMPTEHKSLERKFRRFVQARDYGGAESLLAQLKLDPKASESLKKGLQAEYMFCKENYQAACEMAVDALKLGGDSLSLLNIVGKCLLKLNEFEKALQCFEKANSLCAINVERLLTISEINIKLDRKVEAEDALAKALGIDARNPHTLEIKCGLDLESGRIESAKKGMEGLESVPKIASYINNRAVALARSGRMKESLALYKDAIQCLQPKWVDLSASVAYNLGLAHARIGDYAAAKSVLIGLPSDPQGQCFSQSPGPSQKNRDVGAERTKVVSGRSGYDDRHGSR